MVLSRALYGKEFAMGQRRNQPAPEQESDRAEQARTDYIIVWLAIGMAALFVVFMLADRHHVFDRPERPQNAVIEHPQA
jgi:hypothetical protein